MKYLFFEDYHEDGCGGTVEITDEEYETLKPYSEDMENCNPLPKPLNDLLWGSIYCRDKKDKDELDPYSVKDILVAVIV